MHTSAVDGLCEIVSNWIPARGREVSSLRGSGGRICLRPPAWNAATRIELGRASLAKALRTACLERTEAAGLLWETPAASFVEKARVEAEARPVCLSSAGRTNEAIVSKRFWSS
jgi:hypothetical protein